MSARETLIELQDAAFRYPGRETPALRVAELAVRAGEFLLVAGPTGGGKSTLLKVLAGLLPGTGAGKLEGQRRSADGLRKGVVFQSPDDQIFSTRAGDEVAFGLRQAGVSESEISKRSEAALAAVGLSIPHDADPAQLSGGQKQRLVLAAALALEPRLLVLDEPLSQLDPQGAEEVRQATERLRRERGVAVVLAEHRLEDWLAQEDGAPRLAAVAEGRIAFETGLSDRAARGETVARLAELGLRIPVAAQVAKALPDAWHAGVRDEAGLLAWAKARGVRTGDTQEAADRLAGSATVLEAEGLAFRYAAQGFGLEGVSLRVRQGERIALLGANGCGKSTLLALLGGLRKPAAGRIRGAGRRGFTFQNPDAMLIRDTALGEAAFGPRYGLRLSRGAAEAKGREALAALGLQDRAGEAPLALSRGQRLRLAAASVLAMDVEVLLLDEPTTGQDRLHIERLLDALAEAGTAVVFSTHDVDLACAWADRAVVLREGRVVADGAPHEELAREETVRACGLRAPAVLTLCEKLGVAPCRSVAELAARLGGAP